EPLPLQIDAVSQQKSSWRRYEEGQRLFSLLSEVQPLQPFRPRAYASIAAGRKE
ncbi:uncharacterized, partial [Tachysurus ichikawai]